MIGRRSPHPWSMVPAGLLVSLSLIATLPSCGAQQEAAPAAAPPVEQSVEVTFYDAREGPSAKDEAEDAEAPARSRSEMAGQLGARGGGAPGAPAAASPAAPAPEEPAPADGAAAPDGGPAPARAWFPETFLWQPRLRTDASGTASVPVRMPDRLTDWRVLGLAHTADGAQAGALARVETRLDAYVELVPPPFLRLGDQVDLPVLAVNTTSGTLSGALELRVTDGAAAAQRSAPLTLLPSGHAQRHEPVRAGRLGPLELSARFTAGEVDDAVVHTVEVLPVGRPLTEQRSGTLGSPQALSFDPPPSPSPEATRLRLTVAPGALSVVRAEVEAGRVPAGLAGAAWGLRLAATAPDLLSQLGAPPPAEGPERAALDDKLRKQRLLATQRALRLPVDATPDLLALLLRPALLHPGDDSLVALGLRVAGQLAAAQAPDGTMLGGANGAVLTVDEALLRLAEAVRALDGAAQSPGLPPATTDALALTALRVRVLGEGAAERLLPDAHSPLTQAALLAAGLLRGAAAEAATTAAKAAIVEGDGGLVRFHQGDRSYRSPVAATALAAIGLHRAGAAAEAQRLADALLVAWSPGAAWGRAEDDLLALEAIALIYKGGLPPAVSLRLEREGAVLWSQTLDARQLGELQVFDLYRSDLSGGLSLVADPPLPGAAWSASLRTMVPWELGRSTGVEVAVRLPPNLRAGAPAVAVIEAAVPPETPVTLRWALPAGVRVEERALAQLVKAGSLRSFTAEDGQLELVLPPAQATARSIPVELCPQLAGALQSGAVEAKVNDSWVVVATPTTWQIARP